MERKNSQFNPEDEFTESEVLQPTLEDLEDTESEFRESDNDGEKDDEGLDINSRYRYEIRQVPLLTPIQELALGRAIKEGQLAQARLFDDLDHEERSDFENDSWKGIQALNRLIEANLRLVYSLASKKFSKISKSTDYALEDLIQEGNLGLRRAADKFDYTRGFRFSTYAYWWIKEAIDTFLNNISKGSHKDHRTVNRLGLIAGVGYIDKRGYLRQIDFNHLSPEDLAHLSESSGMTPQEVTETLARCRPITSLDQMLGVQQDQDNDGYSKIQRLKSPDSVDDQAEEIRRDQAIQKVLGNLDPREAKIIALRGGLRVNGYTPKIYTLDEIGKMFQPPISRERVRQIEAEAWKKLREPENTLVLSEFI